MKINLLLSIIFLSIIIYANIDEMHGIVGLTKRDGGLGCLCHDLNPSNSVFVWVEGPDSVFKRDTIQYKIKMTGGPAIAGGFNIASYFGDLNSADTLVQVLFGELTHTSPNPFVNDTVHWNFIYIAPDTLVTDTIYSVANSVNLDGIPSNLDQWNHGPNFLITVTEDIIPIELVSFNAMIMDKNVILDWITETEMNNLGFEIQRRAGNGRFSIENQKSEHWEVIGFVEGKGTTTEKSYYSFTDDFVQAGNYSYRLKQIDFDGSVEYSDVINVEINFPIEFSLEQNYPNPFNPSTNIKFRISDGGLVSLKVYDILGNEITTLISKELASGEYKLPFNASSLSSGTYLYQLKAGDFIQTKKITLLK